MKYELQDVHIFTAGVNHIHEFVVCALSFFPHALIININDLFMSCAQHELNMFSLI